VSSQPEPAASRGLHTRARAARELIRARELDPDIALSFVVWPSPRLAALSLEGRRVYSEETRLRALGFVDGGMSWAVAGRELGVPKPTVVYG
jgi:hypothetical protein